MLIDSLLTLSGSTANGTFAGSDMFGSGTTVVSPNTIDVSSQGVPSGNVRDMGEGQELFARVEITTSYVGGTSVQFEVVASDDAAGTVNTTVIGSSEVVAVANAIAGARYAFPINPRLAKLGQRYITLQAVNVGINTAGAVFADIGTGIQDGQKFYTSGFQVL